jgi:hypothetical protein
MRRWFEGRDTLLREQLRDATTALYSWRAEAALNLQGLVRYREAVKSAMNELGVPGKDYPAPVANAYEILHGAIAGAALREGEPGA